MLIRLSDNSLTMDDNRNNKGVVGRGKSRRGLGKGFLEAL